VLDVDPPGESALQVADELFDRGWILERVFPEKAQDDTRPWRGWRSIFSA
jgi:hypothetical protein